MSDHENSLSSVGAIGVAILLLLIVLVVPAGVGFLYFSRTRAVAAEQQARVSAELAAARERVARTQVAQTAVGDETIVTVRVTGDAALTVDEQVVDLEQLSKLITSKSNCKTVIVVVPPDCTAALMGEISQTCLASGADEVKIVREAMEESP